MERTARIDGGAAEQQRGVRLGRHGLVLAGVDEELPLVGAALEPWRIPPRDWPTVLDGVVELGLELLELRVPWSIYGAHLGAPGLTASADPLAHCDLLGFLEACQRRKLRLLLHLGPLSDAVADGGLPRVAREGRALARGSRGEPLWVPRTPRPFPTPSLASETFLGAAEAWLSAAAEALEPQRHPRGPVVGYVLQPQPDLLGRSGAYDGDYSAAATDAHRRWLEGRYPRGLPMGYGPMATVESVTPPRRFDARNDGELRPHLDWMAFQESLVLEAVARFRRALDGASGDPPLVLHRQLAGADGAGARVSPGALEGEVDGTGVAIAELRGDFGQRRRQVERLVGGSRLPLLLGQPWGGRFGWAPPGLEEQQEQLLTALMYGARGFILDGVVGSAERVAAPLDGSGRACRGPEIDATKRLLSATADLRLHRRIRTVEVGLLEPRSFTRLAAVRSLLAPLPLEVLSLGGLEASALGPRDGPGAEALERIVALREAITAVLDAGRLPFWRVDGESEAAAGRLSLLILPWCAEANAAELLDERLRADLHRFVADDRRELWIVGDAVPGGLPEHRHLRDVDELREALRGHELQPTPLCAESDNTALPSVQRSGDQLQGVLFVANPDAPRQSARLVASPCGQDPSTLRVWDALSGVPLRKEDFELPAGGLRLLRCRRVEAESGGQDEGEETTR